MVCDHYDRKHLNQHHKYIIILIDQFDLIVQLHEYKIDHLHDDDNWHQHLVRVFLRFVHNYLFLHLSKVACLFQEKKLLNDFFFLN
jgi:hypothetical protein